MDTLGGRHWKSYYHKDLHALHFGNAPKTSYSAVAQFRGVTDWHLEPVHVPKPEHLEYHAPSGDDIQVEDDDEDPEEDLEEYPSEEHEPEDDNEDPKEDPNEDHEPENSDETEPLEEDETAVTPPPPRHHRARISVRPQTPMTTSTHALIDKKFPLPVLKDATARRKVKALPGRLHCYAKSKETVIEFDDSYVVPANTTDTTSGDKSGRTVTLTAEDMQRDKNDAAILKTFGGNEATKKIKKNLLKQQYGNFKAEGSKTLEQTFNRLQVIIGQLQFMDVDIKQDDLNQK
nr:hypothetical protein [Tanacetum cinerariifolium]